MGRVVDWVILAIVVFVYFMMLIVVLPYCVIQRFRGKFISVNSCVESCISVGDYFED